MKITKFLSHIFLQKFRETNGFYHINKLGNNWFHEIFFQWKTWERISRFFTLRFYVEMSQKLISRKVLHMSQLCPILLSSSLTCMRSGLGKSRGKEVRLAFSQSAVRLPEAHLHLQLRGHWLQSLVSESKSPPVLWEAVVAMISTIRGTNNMLRPFHIPEI